MPLVCGCHLITDLLIAHFPLIPLPVPQSLPPVAVSLSRPVKGRVTSGWGERVGKSALLAVSVSQEKGLVKEPVIFYAGTETTVLLWEAATSVEVDDNGLQAQLATMFTSYISGQREFDWRQSGTKSVSVHITWSLLYQIQFGGWGRLPHFCSCF